MIRAAPTAACFLGLKEGTISELELHTIRSRLTAGLLAKAERGRARSHPCRSSLVRDPSGVVVRDPDMAVQERLQLVFGMFPRFGTVAKVMRMLNGRTVSICLTPRPTRRFALDASDDLISGGNPEKSGLCRGLHVYGRTFRIRETTREGASRAKTPRPIEEWRIVVKDRYPAYIDWQTYERIRAAIRGQPSRIHAHQNPRHAARQ